MVRQKVSPMQNFTNIFSHPMHKLAYNIMSYQHCGAGGATFFSELKTYAHKSMFESG